MNCSFCKSNDCECGPCERCPPHARQFHKNNKDGLCETCLICPTCKTASMGWDSYDESWACAFCLDKAYEHERKEMIDHPYHTVRKDVPIYLKDRIWSFAFGSAKEGSCFSCQIRIRPPRFCCVQIGEDFLPICSQCSKNINQLSKTL